MGQREESKGREKKGKKGVREGRKVGGKRMEWSRVREGGGRGKAAGKETQKEGWKKGGRREEREPGRWEGRSDTGRKPSW